MAMDYEKIRERFEDSMLPQSIKRAAEEYLDASEDIGLDATPVLPLDIAADFLEYVKHCVDDVPPADILLAERAKEDIASFFWHPFNPKFNEMSWDEDDDYFHIERFANALRNDARFRHIFLGAMDLTLVNLEEDVMQSDTSSEAYGIMREISGNFSGWTDLALNAMKQAEE